MPYTSNPPVGRHNPDGQTAGETGAMYYFVTNRKRSNKMKPLRSSITTQGRKMAGARSLWRANGMKEEQIGQPVIAIVNSFTQFVPGHTHLHEIGQQIKGWIEQEGCFAAEFNTIAIDDGIAMGHDGKIGRAHV